MFVLTDVKIAAATQNMAPLTPRLNGKLAGPDSRGKLTIKLVYVQCLDT